VEYGSLALLLGVNTIGRSNTSEIIEMDQNSEPAHTFIAETYQKKGMYEEAIAELKAPMSRTTTWMPMRWLEKEDEAQKYS